jgi:pyruvate/2-oxoglutarate/acetoin dehydrogenase E1 component
LLGTTTFIPGRCANVPHRHVRIAGHLGRLLVVDENYLSFGLIALVAERDPGLLHAPAARVAVPDVPIPYARSLEYAVLPTAERIRRAVLELVEA